jgi:predicted small secreted protein/Tfp pilus assembly protein PilV
MMKIHRILAIALVLLLSVSLMSCTTPSGTYSPGKSAGAGALGGAAAGAAIGSIIGAATGSPATGAWVGAATGAIAGGIGGALYARHMNQQMRSREAAAQQYNYSSSRGSVVDINEVRTSPTSVRPGQTVDISTTYTILTPQDPPTQVTLYREVRHNGQVVGQPHSVQATNKNGTHQDRVGFTVPRSAPPGTYMVSNRISSSYGTAERSAYFTVVQ